MQLRNGEWGYGAITKLLHWLTVAAFATQFAVGYTMDAEGEADVEEVDCDPPGDDVSGGDQTDAEKDILEELEEDCEQAAELREEEAEDAVGTAWSDLLTGDLGPTGFPSPKSTCSSGSRSWRSECCASCGDASPRCRPGTPA